VVQDFQVRAADVEFLLEAAVMPSSSMAFNSFRGLTIDITARKRTRKPLVAMKARYRVLADLIPRHLDGAPDAASLTPIKLLDYLA